MDFTVDLLNGGTFDPEGISILEAVAILRNPKDPDFGIKMAAMASSAASRMTEERANDGHDAAELLARPILADWRSGDPHLMVGAVLFAEDMRRQVVDNSRYWTSGTRGSLLAIFQAHDLLGDGPLFP